jgi:hypothetical protein
MIQFCSYHNFDIFTKRSKAMLRLTKGHIGKVMAQLERAQTLENAQEAAALLGHPIQIDIDGKPLYRGTVYPEQAELIDDLLVDLGNKQRSI